MSYRVLVIPEDPTHNGYILKPLLEKMLELAGRPRAKVTILTNPRLSGYASAVSAINNELVERYGHWDLWVFCPDADKAGSLDRLEQELKSRGIRLLCCAARPEIEAWVLAGHREKLKTVSWGQVAGHPRLKEDVFAPFLREHGQAESAGGGRKELMQQTLANYRGLLEVCLELKELDRRLVELLSGKRAH